MTGGGAGIGRATAKLMAACGARVHICDIDEAALKAVSIEARGVLPCMADVASFPSVQALFELVEGQSGRLDILVNNVGIAGQVAGIESLSPEQLRLTLAANLESQFYCAREAVRLMPKGEGAIINVSSIAGRLGYARRTSYSASKWGVIGLTKSLAAELGGAGIRVNAVCPGAVDGPPLTRAIQKRAERRGIPEDAVRDELRAQSSMRCFVTADDVAQLIVFLSSNAAKTISGQVIGVDGDTTHLV